MATTFIDCQLLNISFRVNDACAYANCPDFFFLHFKLFQCFHKIELFFIFLFPLHLVFLLVHHSTATMGNQVVRDFLFRHTHKDYFVCKLHLVLLIFPSIHTRLNFFYKKTFQEIFLYLFSFLNYIL